MRSTAAAAAADAVDTAADSTEIAAPADAEPTATEPLSTGGLIAELDPAPTPTGDPEVTKPAPKRSRKKAE